MTIESSRATDEALIRGLIEERVEAVRAKDIDSLMSNHAPDVLMFDALNPLRYTGSDAVRERAGQRFSWYQGTIGYEVRDRERACLRAFQEWWPPTACKLPACGINSSVDGIGGELL